MKSKMSRSFNPLIGFAKSQFHSLLFSTLIFTVILTAAALAIGANPLFGYAIRDVSYSDPLGIGFSAAMLCTSFAAAAYSFKTFIIRNECDLFLSLPIKKSRLLIFRILFGIICIIFSSFVSFGLIYPAMNIEKISSSAVYATLLKSLFSEIIVPMCAYYLISAALILKFHNFFSAAILYLSLSAVFFFSGLYISRNIGLNAIGADMLEIVGGYQPFFFDSSIFLPSKYIFTLIKTLTFAVNPAVNTLTVKGACNILSAVVYAAVFAAISHGARLDTFGRPFAVRPIIKTLPVGIFLCAAPILLGSHTAEGGAVYIVAAVAAAASSAFIMICFKSIRRGAVYAAACVLISIVPITAPLTNAKVSENITCAVPNPDDVECVYFNPIYPTNEENRIKNLLSGNYYPNSRYCFSERETIEKTVALHAGIVDKIKQYKLTETDFVKLDDGFAVTDSKPLEFAADSYAEYINSTNAEKDDSDTAWGFRQNDVMFDYWSLFYDYGDSIEISPCNYINVSADGALQTSGSYNYYMTIYYKLKSGRWLYRLYSPIPVSWIEENMLAVVNTDEFEERRFGTVEKSENEGENIPF